MTGSLVHLIGGASWARFRTVLATCLVLSLAGVLMSLPGTNLPFEGTIYDLWLEDHQSDAQGPPSKVVLVVIDDQSVSNPRRSQPEVFSPSVWAAVLDALVVAGVKAVAIHRTLPVAESRSLADEGAWFQAIRDARRMEIPVIYGYRHRASQALWPSAKYLEIMGRDSLGFLDLVHDRDDKVRRQPVTWPESPGGEPADRPVLSFAYLAAAAANPAVNPRSDPYYIDFARPLTRLGFADLHERAVGGRMDVFGRALADAVVVIGDTSSLNMDAWPTPVSEYGRDGRWSLTPAVEIQAHAIDTLLSGASKSHPGLGVTWMLFFGAVFLALIPALLSPPRGGRHPLPWAPPVVMALYPLVAYLAFKRGVMLPVIPGLAALAMANLLYFGLRVRETAQRQRAGSRALNLYLNPALAGQIIDDPEVLGRRGESRQATVLFADLVGFTSLAESMDTASVVDLLNRYFETMNTAIERYDGYVDKFMGDGIMAVWGAPSSQPLHAVSACLSALMQAGLMERLNHDLAAAGQPVLQALMGLSTGEVIAGNIGASQRLNYTVMGDPVNLASRLVSINKLYGTTILATEATKKQAGDKVVFRALDRVRVKGRKGASPIYEVLAPAGALDERITQGVNYFERALRHYFDRDFQGALARVEAALKLMPGDNPGRQLARRCRERLADPPGPEWDGVTVLEVK